MSVCFSPEQTLLGPDILFSLEDAGDTLAYLQSRPGCNGGGLSTNSPSTSITAILSGGIWRQGIIEANENEDSSTWEWKMGTCRPSPEGCGLKNVEVGPCKLCRQCQKDYDRGKRK